eukprot:scaffold43372_cov191-Amphora_coffeaeformis.AAC.1
MDTAEGLFLDICRLEIPEILLPEEKLNKTTQCHENALHGGLFRSTAKRVHSTLSCQLDTISETDDSDDPSASSSREPVQCRAIVEKDKSPSKSFIHQLLSAMLCSSF